MGSIVVNLKQVEVLLPETAYAAIETSLNSKLQKLRYARVFMSLSNLLEGDFFNTYIKSGILPYLYVPLAATS